MDLKKKVVGTIEKWGEAARASNRKAFEEKKNLPELTYKLVSHSNTNSLEEEISALMRDGWRPTGGVFYQTFGGVYYQAMFREPEKNVPANPDSQRQ